MAGGPLLLVLNVGSSSLKAALFESSTAGPQPRVSRTWDTQLSLGDQSLRAVLSGQLAKDPQLNAEWPRIALVGHRVVHGGERFTRPTRLDASVLADLQALVPLAPLHNGPALEAIGWLQQAQPELPQWACFDTAFHASLSPAASSYALPLVWRQQGLRRFGFHGLNHQHLAERAAAHWRSLGRPGLPRTVSAHLGAGCSLAAIAEGRSIDTSMGFTPLEGLVMASRSGSVDPGLLLHLLRQGVSTQELDDTLNHRSGLLGLSGLSGDWRKLRQAADSGHAGARLALAVFQQRLLAGIGAMAASLQGVDVLALSGGIGANDPQLAADLRHALGWLGSLELLQLPADEEGMIARLCLEASLSCDRADPASGAAVG